MLQRRCVYQNLEDGCCTSFENATPECHEKACHLSADIHWTDCHVLAVRLGRKAFSFSSFVQWVNKAQSWFAQRGLRGDDVICLDQKGRVCKIGRDFNRARDDESFPVDVYVYRDESEL